MQSARDKILTPVSVYPDCRSLWEPSPGTGSQVYHGSIASIFDLPVTVNLCQSHPVVDSNHDGPPVHRGLTTAYPGSRAIAKQPGPESKFHHRCGLAPRFQVAHRSGVMTGSRVLHYSLTD